jgi:hypothetical protein
MTARFNNAEVRANPDRSITASFEVRNLTGDAWRPSAGFAMGYHIFDPATDTLVVDGPRTPPGADIAPGETCRFEMRCELPAETGRYRVFVSGMQEHSHWLYERGAEFLLIDGAVEGGRASVERFRVATEGGVRRERMLRSLKRAFTLPVETIVRHRSLIRTMVRRDVLGRYRGSFGGAFWTVLNPLILMLTYFFVFGVVLRTRFPNDPSRSGFALYFLAGMLPWLALSEALGRAPTVMLEHRNFVKKLVFPVETLPVNVVISGGLVPGTRLHSGIHRMAAGAGGPADSADGGAVLVSGRARSLRARLGARQRISADAVVLSDAHLLSRKFAARPGVADSVEEPNVRPGSGISRRAARGPRAGSALAVETVRGVGCDLRTGSRVVLQAAEVLRGYYLTC